MLDLPDVQKTTDSHHPVQIDEVGVSDIRYPIVVPTLSGEPQHTVGNISMTVGLDAELKGTHMSRFMRILSRSETAQACQPWRAPTLPKLLLPELLTKLDATRAQVRVSFPYFLNRHAPKTGLAGINTYDCWLAAALVGVVAKGGEPAYQYHIEAGVDVAVATLCPCSREISDRGAHNQRGHVRLTMGYKHEFTGQELLAYQKDEGVETAWFEAMVETVEQSASCVLFPVLKRPDEKHVTEEAYDNPCFVEDVVRNIAKTLSAEVAGRPYDWAHIRSVNHESIHQHNAVARIMLGEPSHLIHDWI